jgi:hypothetical protein
MRIIVRELGVVIGEYKRLRGSWTEIGQKFELNHTFQRLDEI